MSDNTNLPAVSDFSQLAQSIQANTAIKLDEQSIAEVSVQGLKTALQDELSARSALLDEVRADFDEAFRQLTKAKDQVVRRLRDRFTESVAGSMEGLVTSLAPLSQSQQSFGDLDVVVHSLDLAAALTDYKPEDPDTGIFPFGVTIQLSHLPKPGLRGAGPQKSDFEVNIQLSASESLTAFPELLEAQAYVVALAKEKTDVEASVADVRKKLARIPDEIERRRRKVQEAILNSSETGRQLLGVINASETEARAELERTRVKRRTKA